MAQGNDLTRIRDRAKAKADRKRSGGQSKTIKFLLVALIIAIGYGITDYLLRDNESYMISKQFSMFSGVHKPLQAWIKENLKDPDSYEHIETKYIQDYSDRALDVRIKFRANNSLGGKIVDVAVGKYTPDGRQVDAYFASHKELTDMQNELKKELQESEESYQRALELINGAQ